MQMRTSPSIISALSQGRKGVGAEINKKYIKIICDRIEQLEKGFLKTRPMNTPIYDPKEPKKWAESLCRKNDNQLDQTNLFKEAELDFY